MSVDQLPSVPEIVEGEGADYESAGVYVAESLDELKKITEKLYKVLSVAVLVIIPTLPSEAVPSKAPESPHIQIYQSAPVPPERLDEYLQLQQVVEDAADDGVLVR